MPTTLLTDSLLCHARHAPGAIGDAVLYATLPTVSPCASAHCVLPLYVTAPTQFRRTLHNHRNTTTIYPLARHHYYLSAHLAAKTRWAGYRASMGGH